MNEANSVVLSLENVSKFYKLYGAPSDRLKEALSPFGRIYHKKHYAAKNLNLTINRGEIVGIVGQNGSGKSTLLKLIAGVLSADEGQVSIRGKVSALLELGSGFNPEFTGMENIFFYATILGFTKAQINEKLEDIIAFADIGDYLYQPLKSYSSGMKSRLGFAVAVHIDPEILILDEVLAVGDALFKRKCYAKMEEFFKSGKTIIYVSHEINSINLLCTRAVFLDAGAILMDGDTKTVTKYYQKYLFSKPAEREKLRNDMLGQRIAISKEPSRTQKPTPLKKKADKAYLAPNFIAKSTVAAKNIDLDIEACAIETVDGEAVNMLPLNQEFVFAYTVTLPNGEMDFETIDFGMQIKDIKGVIISGTNTKRQNAELPALRPMRRYRIAWTFVTNLHPGEYFTNAALFVEQGEETLYSKVLDACVFKVVSPEPPLFAGKTYLEQRFSIKEADRV